MKFSEANNATIRALPAMQTAMRLDRSSIHLKYHRWRSIDKIKLSIVVDFLSSSFHPKYIHQIFRYYIIFFILEIKKKLDCLDEGRGSRAMKLFFFFLPLELLRSLIFLFPSSRIRYRHGRPQFSITEEIATSTIFNQIPSDVGKFLLERKVQDPLFRG